MLNFEQMLMVRRRLKVRKPVVQRLINGLAIAPLQLSSGPAKMTWKIEKHSEGPKTTIRLIGRIQVEHLDDLQKLINEGKSPIVLDLGELMLVDLEAVRFLGRCLNDGVSLLRCPQYIGRWIAKEQDRS